MNISNDYVMTCIANAVALSSANMDTADEIFVEYVNERYIKSTFMRKGILKILQSKYLDKLKLINENRSIQC